MHITKGVILKSSCRKMHQNSMVLARYSAVPFNGQRPVLGSLLLKSNLLQLLVTFSKSNLLQLQVT